MKLNTKVRYAARVMLELALHYNEGTLALNEIATQQELPEKYIESLASTLRAAGLIHGQRGAQGGYNLARPPEQITIYDIYQAFEGGEAYAPCTQDHNVCQRQSICVTQDIWAEMYLAATGVLKKYTLADLVKRHYLKQQNAIDMYTI